MDAQEVKASEEVKHEEIIPVHKVDKGFAIFGKLALGVLIGAGFLFGGYYLGTRYNHPSSVPTHTMQPTATVVTPTVVQVSPTVSQATTTPSTAPTAKQISAGIKTDFFSTYTITVPSDWVDVHQSDPSQRTDTLTLTKGQYVLTISQASGGAGPCVYPGDPAEPMAQSFTSFVGITGVSSQFRRGTSDSMNYAICQQKTNGYAFPTSFGNITYNTPKSSDASVLAEMDGVVASLK